MIPTDFFVFHTLEILKTFEIRSFFKEKRLLSHVLAEPKTYFCKQKYVFKPLWSHSHKNVCKHTFYDHLTLVSYHSTFFYFFQSFFDFLHREHQCKTHISFPHTSKGMSRCADNSCLFHQFHFQGLPSHHISPSQKAQFLADYRITLQFSPVSPPAFCCVP